MPNWKPYLHHPHTKPVDRKANLERGTNGLRVRPQRTHFDGIIGAWLTPMRSAICSWVSLSEIRGAPMGIFLVGTPWRRGYFFSSGTNFLVTLMLFSLQGTTMFRRALLHVPR
jgi:hypothetical protein